LRTRNLKHKSLQKFSNTRFRSYAEETKKIMQLKHRLPELKGKSEFSPINGYNLDLNFVEACDEFLSMMLELLGLFESEGANWQTGEFLPVLQHIIIWTTVENPDEIDHPKSLFLKEIKAALLSCVFEQLFQQYPDARGNIVGRSLI
jgi:hypothetical protein